MSALRPAVRGTISRINAARSYHGLPADYKRPTMNDLPLPQGSWQDKFNADQKKYNLILASGVGILSATLVCLKASGFELHMDPPETYE